MRSNFLNTATYLGAFAVGVAFVLMVMPGEVLAQGFIDADVLPASQQSKSVLEKVAWIILIGAIMFIVGVTFFAGGELISSLVSSLADSRKSGEWGGFFRNLALVLLVLVIIIFIAALFYDAATGGISFSPTVTVG